MTATSGIIIKITENKLQSKFSIWLTRFRMDIKAFRRGNKTKKVAVSNMDRYHIESVHKVSLRTYSIITDLIHEIIKISLN